MPHVVLADVTAHLAHVRNLHHDRRPLHAIACHGPARWIDRTRQGARIEDGHDAPSVPASRTELDPVAEDVEVMDMPGRPGVQVGHGAVDIHETNPSANRAMSRPTWDHPNRIGVIGQGVTERFGFASVFGDDEGREAVGDAFRISG